MKTPLLYPLIPILASLVPAAAADDRLNVAECFARMPLEVFHRWYRDNDHSTRRLERAKKDVAKAAAGESNTWSRVDLANGYIVYPGDDGGEFGTLTLALFRQPDGTALIAAEIGETYEQYDIDLLERRPELKGVKGDLSATVRLEFHRVTKEGWKNVTDEICPEPEAKEVRYELPKKGTTIHLYRRGAEKPFRAWVRDGKGFKAKVLQ